MMQQKRPNDLAQGFCPGGIKAIRPSRTSASEAVPCACLD
jgi:hypothetical protein